jgi:PTH1 family peptidyl-tRNA hydrolase
MDLADYVLGRFPKEQQAVMEEAYRDAADAACMMIEEGADAAMNHYNRKHKENS